MADPLMALFRVCTPLHQGPVLAGSHLAAMAMLGLAGSLVHCGPMCGPLVLGQTANRLSCLACDRMSELTRFRAALLPGYHAGRLTTYTALGAFAGLLGMGAAEALQPLRGVILALAAAALLGAAWRQFGRRDAPRPSQRGLLHRLGLGRLRPGGVSFGLAMGFLPCGLLYTALLAAAATASPLLGAAAMLAFGLGTVPMLAAVASAGSITVLQPWLRRAAPAIFVLNALFLLAAALQAGLTTAS